MVSRRQQKVDSFSLRQQHEQHLFLWVIVLIVVLALTLEFTHVPGDKEVTPLCSAPYVMVEERCCLDDNRNGVCDELEEGDPSPLAPPVVSSLPFVDDSPEQPLLSFPVTSLSMLPGAYPVFLGGFVDVDDDPSLGDVYAPVTVIEFCNYEILPCITSYDVVLPQLKEDYITPGLVYYVYRDYILPHDQASLSVVGANCARDQEAFWDMHDLLLSKRRYGTDYLLRYAEDLGLQKDMFRDCLEENNLYDIKQDYADGKEAGLQGGVPVFFVNGVKVVSSDYDVLKDVLEKVLEELV